MKIIKKIKCNAQKIVVEIIIWIEGEKIQLSNSKANQNEKRKLNRTTMMSIMNEWYNTNTLEEKIINN